MGKIVLIEQFDEGFMILGTDGKSSAIPDPEQLIRRLEKEFGFSDLIRPVQDSPELKKIADDVEKIITSPQPLEEFQKQQEEAGPNPMLMWHCACGTEFDVSRYKGCPNCGKPVQSQKEAPLKTEAEEPIHTMQCPAYPSPAIKEGRKHPEECNCGAAPFIFQEPPPFNWRGVSEKVSGKTKYQQASNVIRITREGYFNQVYVSIEQLKRLKAISLNGPTYALTEALSEISGSKRTLIYSFLREVDFKQFETKQPKAPDEEHDPDRPYRAFGLNRLTRTTGDGEKIEQNYIDELEKAEGGLNG